MTVNELIKQANDNAIEQSKAYQKLIESHGLKNGISEWNKVRQNFSNFAKHSGIICESTVCHKGCTTYFQNRFYKIKADGFRGSFSKAKAIAELA